MPPPPCRRISYRSLTCSLGRLNRNTGLARQPMTLAMRDEREITWLEQAVIRPLDLEPAPT